MFSHSLLHEAYASRRSAWPLPPDRPLPSWPRGEVLNLMALSNSPESKQARARLLVVSKYYGGQDLYWPPFVPVLCVYIHTYAYSNFARCIHCAMRPSLIFFVLNELMTTNLAFKYWYVIDYFPQNLRRVSLQIARNILQNQGGDPEGEEWLPSASPNVWVGQWEYQHQWRGWAADEVSWQLSARQQGQANYGPRKVLSIHDEDKTAGWFCEQSAIPHHGWSSQWGEPFLSPNHDWILSFLI